MRRGAAVAALVLALLLSRGSAGAQRHARPWTRTTGDYGRSKAPMLAQRWARPEVRDAAVRWARALLPGLPPLAFLALGASSTGQHEHLRGSEATGARGLWGVEPALVGRWSSDDRTLRELGRRYDPAHYGDDVEAQAYTGARRYADAVLAGRRAVGWSGPPVWDPWDALVAVAAYSSGPGRTAQVLGGVTRATWLRRAREVAQAIEGGAATVRGAPARGIGGAASTFVRPLERLASARAVSALIEGPDAEAVHGWWDLFDGTLPRDVDVALSAATHRP